MLDFNYRERLYFLVSTLDLNISMGLPPQAACECTLESYKNVYHPELPGQMPPLQLEPANTQVSPSAEQILTQLRDETRDAQYWTELMLVIRNTLLTTTTTQHPSWNLMRDKNVVVAVLDYLISYIHATLGTEP